MSNATESPDLQEEVERLRERLAQSANELQDFLYIVSHDFRGPLRAIMSSSMILIEDYGDSLDAEAKSELRRQSEAARKLNRLLDELLKLSRLNRQELNRQQVDLGATVQRMVDARDLGPSVLDLEGDLHASVDRDLIDLLLEALVDNSIKFAQANVTPRIAFGKDEQGFYFRDNGIGLDPERAGRVFLPFERLNGDEYAGLGMGLALSKRIVNRHDGAISAEGAPNEGTTIRFTLPGGA